MSNGSGFANTFQRKTFPMTVPAASRFRHVESLKRLLWILNTGAQWHMLPQGYPN